MSNYQPHTLVTFGGVLNITQAPSEIWQCGIRVLSDSQGPVADHDAYLAGIAEPLSTWFMSSEVPSIPNSCQLSWVKANAIGANGKYTETTTHVHDYNPPVAGSLSASPPGFYPDILAVAISWGTAKAVRKGVYATHGRIYLPAYGNSAKNTGSMRMTDGQNGLWAARGAALLHILGGSAVPAMPIVASGHGGEFLPITSVRVGDVYDVQRRRKDALKEVYSSLPYIG